MLEVLRGAGLSDTAVVVTRWFGGTLLGAGGLAVRACVCEQAASNHDPAQDGSETSDRLVRVTLNVFWKR